MLRTFKDLKVWQKSYELCRRVYAVTSGFPQEERFGLVAQLRRASVAVPSNIAEGYSRDTTKDYLRFLWMALGSLAEIETQLMLSLDLSLCRGEEVTQAIEDVHEDQRMLKALVKSLKSREAHVT